MGRQPFGIKRSHCLAEARFAIVERSSLFKHKVRSIRLNIEYPNLHGCRTFPLLVGKRCALCYVVGGRLGQVRILTLVCLRDTFPSILSAYALTYNPVMMNFKNFNVEVKLGYTLQQGRLQEAAPQLLMPPYHHASPKDLLNVDREAIQQALR